MTMASRKVNDEVTENSRLGKLKTKLDAKLPSHKKELKSLRITNDNIEEHRVDILAKGRKLKYPIQYSKRRLIAISLLVVIVAITAFSVWLNIALYKQQQTGDFFFSVTKVLPLNVAKVDGTSVRYEDYLRRLRADIHYYLNREQRSFNSEEGKRELDYRKRINLDVAEKAAYVHKLAEENSISVSREQIDEEIKQMREADGATEEDLINTLELYYGWSLADFQVTVEDQLLERAVAYAIDDEARAKIEDIERRLEAGEDFATLAAQLSDDDSSKQNGGVVTVNLEDNARDPSGIVDLVSELKIGETMSEPGRVQIDNTNYYYIARLDRLSEESISYSIIMVRLDKLNNMFAQVQNDGQIEEYIEVPSLSNLTTPAEQQ